MKLQDIKVKKKKVKPTPEAINPALSFESTMANVVEDPVSQELTETWDQFKNTKHALKPIPERVNENLRNWFKQKWVRFGPDGKIRGECGGRSEGEGKPKCLPQSKAHSLGKKGRASAAARKRREDPNPERSGAAINVATKKKTTEAQEYCPECGGSMYPETMINEKKDACYYKVKSRYKVWPSAYASGALVRCRKKGAKSWGSKSKNESVDESQLDEKWSEKYKRSINCANPRGFSQRAHCQGRKKNEDQQLDEKCWDGYQQQGMKKKGARMVPNCVPKESVNEANMKDLAMDLKDLSDGEFFEKYKKSKGQMQSSLEPMYVIKDPNSFLDDDFYAYDPNTKILKSTWSPSSVGRWHSEFDAQQKGLSIARGLRAKRLGLKVKRRLENMLEADVSQDPITGKYSVSGGKDWKSIKPSKANIPGALIDLAKQGLGFKKRYNTGSIEKDPRSRARVGRHGNDDWVIIDPQERVIATYGPGSTWYNELKKTAAAMPVDYNVAPGMPLPSAFTGKFPVNSSLLVAIPGNLANRRGIYESTDNAAFIVYMDGNPVTKHDTPEAAKLNAKRLADRFANHKIEVRQEQCTEKLLATITENLKWMMS